MPGISLISPPPHHDIYSIEDLSQLIYDLKQVSPTADISVKLVAEAGVGTIAAGVAKGGAEVVHISGHSGGTGAAPLSSIKHAGVNWELGLAESQQTLVLNGLRGRVRVRIDGGIKTGRDVVMAGLLGADEVSFGTAALVAEGCVMARTCHSNNCPVGVATQRPELRAKFTGTPDQVVHFLLHVAQEVRELLAELGARTFDEIVGRSDLLSQIERHHDDVSLARLIEYVAGPADAIRAMGEPNTTVATSAINQAILTDAQPALRAGTPVTLSYAVTNTDRTIAATLSGAIAKQYGSTGLPRNTVTLQLRGSAGQSLGAFMAAGIAIQLDGESNDYVGKGMSGGSIRIRPSCEARYTWSDNAIIGNTCLYGATGGELYAAGRAGERFAVRNSGAVAVIEGTGDHACEYMTGGVVLILGDTGRNVAAGMTGGLLYVYDADGHFSMRFNGDMAEAERLRDEDDSIVLALLKRHAKETTSPVPPRCSTTGPPNAANSGVCAPVHWPSRSCHGCKQSSTIASLQVCNARPFSHRGDAVHRPGFLCIALLHAPNIGNDLVMLACQTTFGFVTEEHIYDTPLVGTPVHFGHARNHLGSTGHRSRDRRR
jgi:glutamate synthase (ferredoxin)